MIINLLNWDSTNVTVCFRAHSKKSVTPFFSIHGVHSRVNVLYTARYHAKSTWILFFTERHHADFVVAFPFFPTSRLCTRVFGVSVRMARIWSTWRTG